ncbi:hypothetical protein GCM10022237_43670 [Nocardioides ginsengisoli]|uniref:Uncharacterized protein n=1 Tax=Nocardioides ginsengisoli TaxID=363868 RepID=A0ABW3VXD9_9ACTN
MTERDEDHRSDQGVDRADRSSQTVTPRTVTVVWVRENLARAVWIVCMTLALVLAIAAFTYALEANSGNGLVKLARDLANVFDLGVFDLDNPVKAFKDPNGAVKTALFNYGLGAVVYLVLGRILERIIRP